MRNRKRKAPVCKPLRFKITQTAYYGGHPNYPDLDLHGFMGRKLVGKLRLSFKRFKSLGDVLVVQRAEVTTPRCGVGTRMYEKAAAIACEHRARLISDRGRTVASQGFWAKQTRKGRARCVPSDMPGERLKWDSAVNDFVWTGEWPCERYVMKEACPKKINLSGTR